MEMEDRQPAVEGGGCWGQLLQGLPAPSLCPPLTHHPLCRAEHKARGGGTAPALTVGVCVLGPRLCPRRGQGQHLPQGRHPKISME